MKQSYQACFDRILCWHLLLCCSSAQPDALSYVCLQPPTITGRYTGASFNFFFKHALGGFQDVMAALKALAHSAASALRGDGCSQYTQLQEDIAALESSRCAAARRRQS